MQDNRASKSYKNFTEVVCAYFDAFGGLISMDEILNTPYPLFYDVLLKQFERKKKQKEKIDQQRGIMKGTNYKTGDF